MERTLVALFVNAVNDTLVTPDALLRVARETVPDEIPNIGTILELLGALELKGVIERGCRHTQAEQPCRLIGFP